MIPLMKRASGPVFPDLPETLRRGEIRFDAWAGTDEGWEAGPRGAMPPAATETASQLLDFRQAVAWAEPRNGPGHWVEIEAQLTQERPQEAEIVEIFSRYFKNRFGSVEANEARYHPELGTIPLQLQTDEWDERANAIWDKHHPNFEIPVSYFTQIKWAGADGEWGQPQITVIADFVRGLFVAGGEVAWSPSTIYEMAVHENEWRKLP